MLLLKPITFGVIYQDGYFHTKFTMCFRAQVFTVVLFYHLCAKITNLCYQNDHVRSYSISLFFNSTIYCTVPFPSILEMTVRQIYCPCSPKAFVGNG